MNELISKVEKQYPVSAFAKERAIIGTSRGGLTAVYFSFSKPKFYGLAGNQSPAFWFRPEIYSYCDNPNKPPIKTFMNSGLLNNTQEGANKMKAILNKKTCTYEFKEVNHGHF